MILCDATLVKVPPGLRAYFCFDWTGLAGDCVSVDCYFVRQSHVSLVMIY